MEAQTPEIAPKADTMLDAAAEVEKAYTDAIQQTGNDPVMDNLPWEVRDKVKSFGVNPQFREDIETLQIPQFFPKVEQSLFTDGSFELLDREMLAEGFTLKGKAYDIDFAEGVQDGERRTAVLQGVVQQSAAGEPGASMQGYDVQSA